MTIEKTVTGTQKEMEFLFDNYNIRFYVKINDKWKIIIRHKENIFKRVRTIKGIIKKFKNGEKN